jgi:hypothetical protein
MNSFWDLLEPRPPQDGPPVPRFLPGWPWAILDYRNPEGGEIIRVKVGRKFAISKSQYPDSSDWQAHSTNESILTLIGTSYRYPELSFLGTTGLRYFTFSANAVGSATVILNLQSPGILLPVGVVIVQVQVS